MINQTMQEAQAFRGAALEVSLSEGVLDPSGCEYQGVCEFGLLWQVLQPIEVPDELVQGRSRELRKVMKFPH